MQWCRIELTMGFLSVSLQRSHGSLPSLPMCLRNLRMSTPSSIVVISHLIKNTRWQRRKAWGRNSYICSSGIAVSSNVSTSAWIISGLMGSWGHPTSGPSHPPGSTKSISTKDLNKMPTAPSPHRSESARSFSRTWRGCWVWLASPAG